MDEPEVIVVDEADEKDEAKGQKNSGGSFGRFLGGVAMDILTEHRGEIVTVAGAAVSKVTRAVASGEVGLKTLPRFRFGKYGIGVSRKRGPRGEGPAPEPAGADSAPKASPIEFADED